MTSQIDEIRRLLCLYYAGNSSTDDERELIKLMTEVRDLPEDLIADREIILGIESYGPKTPSSLPVKLNALIARLDSENRRRSKIHRIATAITVAASVTALLAAGYIYVRDTTPNPYEVTDPKTAFNETRRALMLVSEGLNSTDDFIDEASTTLSGIEFQFYENCDDEFPEDSINMNDEKI